MARLFSDDQQFTELVPGSHNLSLAVMQARIDDVVERHIIPVTTRVVYEEMIALLNQEAAVEGINLKFIELARKAVVHIALAQSTTDLNVRASAGGFTVNAQSETTAVASAERVRQFAENRSMDAQLAMDDLIEFMDANAASFAGYGASVERIQLHQHFIHSTSQLNSIMVMRPGRWVLQMMAPVFEYVEEKYLRSALCDELYVHLKSLLTTRSGVTATTPVDYDVYKPLIRHIELAVAHLGMQYAIDELGLKLNVQNGFYKSFYKNANEPAQSQNVGDYGVLKVQAHHKAMGAEALSNLSKELQKNFANYPLYANSECYTNSISREVYMREEDMNGGAAFLGCN